MKSFIVFLVWIVTLPAAAENVRHRINYHLKSVETKIQQSDSEARLRALEAHKSLEEVNTPVYIPHYGVGGDYNATSPSQYETEPLMDPLSATPDDQRRGLSSSGSPKTVVDPTTLQMRGEQ